MSLRGTVKQYVYEITNDMSVDSCKKLRGLVHLLSDQNLQVSMNLNLSILLYHYMIQKWNSVIGRETHCV